MARGLGVNKPCVKCGRDVPFSFKSPIPGFCGRCTDEVLRTLGADKHGPGLGTKDAMVIGPSTGQKVGWAALGGALAVVVVIVVAALAPGAFDAVRDGLRGLLGLG